jgi:hypothetical protein
MNSELPAVGASASTLSKEDSAALRRTVSDVSDLDQRTVERVHAGFRRAYEVAEKVSDGTRDPLSA